ncbi:biotin carboxylase N-terminal domain-containing protein [Ignisphaera sp. 4213-co]|uniref:Biotin carboxylase N-terminal domain-containing protein n=1 Tax=Ignisphaera cupida TaxID=3050454 RepID=A0ABD4Z5Y4_9CREN|nr:biotin carboxylase N-terminal domain-containing protein [Ignisphaera sp. 4213-co]MDK6028721.1 biotin carboxylase N-terminal domain-containing protein [Ignisphaera sp. 4213-co]
MVDRISRLLIANRGEIAVRIIKTCRKLGIKTIAIYTNVDSDAMHVKLADEAYSLGSNPYAYLDIDKIISIVKRSNADAVHPGYGFLSENAKFAKAVEDSGAIWIGPKWSVIELLESKSRTREIANSVGVPIVPGSINPVSLDEAKKIAKQIGFPVLIKADRGGGGRGIRIANNMEELEKLFTLATKEAETSFGHARLYIEKFIPRVRHIEVQILADVHGNVVALSERECSIQRRYQKVIEEAPSPVITYDDRRRLYDYAIRFMKSVKYVNAGTVEFIRDEKGNFYLIEVNKRIQVEHPVTEVITGVDIVEQQIKIAEGRELEIKESIYEFSKHAIEARIYAEDPEKMLPSPGRVTWIQFPNEENIRIDHALAPGVEIPPFYDSMIAKVIAWGSTREEARARLVKALSNFVVDGIKTSIPLLIDILNTQEFVRGEYDTMFLSEYLTRRKKTG